ncbi:MAG: tyrosine-type recombinase/integrase, partial [Desulfobacterales bacterium]|nr:tyrosine-type recombinase/integrase [Desulfobacterales bacterium]
ELQKYIDDYISSLEARKYSVKTISKALFLSSQNGNRLCGDTVQTIISDAGKKLGLEIKISPHTFRRSCATELIKSGANIYHVKELLGHESLETLKYYARLTIVDVKKTHAKCHPREKDLE